MKKGKAQHINSNNISKAKAILAELEEAMKKKENDKNNEQRKKNRTIREIIISADYYEVQNKLLDMEFLQNDSDISSDSNSSLSSDSNQEKAEKNSSSNNNNSQ